jgi:hypothetical protein
MVLLTLTLRAKVKQIKRYEGCASSLLSLVRESIEYQKVGEFRKMELSPQSIDSMILGFTQHASNTSSVSNVSDSQNSRR